MLVIESAADWPAACVHGWNRVPAMALAGRQRLCPPGNQTKPGFTPMPWKNRPPR